MAGSYHHIAGVPGDAMDKFNDREQPGGWSLIENMGDAHEAVEELLWLVRRTMNHDQAMALLENEYYPMCRREKPIDDALVVVRGMMER